jgi:hypothetical protein
VLVDEYKRRIDIISSNYKAGFYGDLMSIALFLNKNGCAHNLFWTFKYTY